MVAYKYVGILLTYEQFTQLASNILGKTYTGKHLRQEGLFQNVAYRIECKLPKFLDECFFLPIGCPPSSEKEEDQRVMFVWRIYRHDGETLDNYKKVPYRKGDAVVVAWLAYSGMDLKQMKEQWDTLPEIHNTDGCFVPCRYG